MKSTKRRKSDETAGKGKVRISCTIPEEVDAELCRLARASSLTRSGMAGECIVDAVARGLTITRTAGHARKIIDLPENPGGGGAQDAAS